MRSGWNPWNIADANVGVGAARTFSVTLDGQGSPITTGQKGYAVVPFHARAVSWRLLADQSGSIVIDIWNDLWANFPPTVADSIAGSEKPTLSSQQLNENASLSTWSPNIPEGSVIGVNVDSAATVTRVFLGIKLIPQ